MYVYTLNVNECIYFLETMNYNSLKSKDVQKILVSNVKICLLINYIQPHDC